MSVCPDQNWDSYSYATDTGPIVVGFHTDANKVDQSKFPNCARVQITIKAPNQNGGPSREEAQVLWEMEDRLVEALDAASAPCMLLGRLTHGGIRELVFQVADYTPFRPPVGQWMKQHAGYETDVSEHDGWEFYYEWVWPSEQSWMLIADRRVVDSLIEAGSDPAKLHSLEFAFRGGQEALLQLQASLATRGYTELSFSADEGLLMMAYSSSLDVGAIFRETLAHNVECTRLGIEYDGWGAMIVK